MPIFRRKLGLIEAHQWFKNGDHPGDGGSDSEGDVIRYYRNPFDDGDRVCRGCGHRMHDHGWIDTRSDGHIVCPGDWIFQRANGGFYRCKPDAFEATYELAEEG